MKPTNDYQYIAEELAHVSGIPYKVAAAAVAKAIAGNYADTKERVSHLCGLQGYDPMQGDTCPVCNP